MWKMIIGQAIYQLSVTLILNFEGQYIFPNWDNGHMQTVIFNTFVFMQIFNQYKQVTGFPTGRFMSDLLTAPCSSRRVDNRLNIMEGICSNKWFIGIQLIIIGGQTLIIFFGGAAFSVQPLHQVSQWAVSLMLGALSLLVAVIIRLIPDEFVHELIAWFWSRKKGSELGISREGHHYEWDPALEEIRGHLAFMKKVRGGRLRHVKQKLQHPHDLLPQSHGSSPSRESSPLLTTVGDNSESGSSNPELAFPQARSSPVFGPVAAMAGVVAGSVAGWAPIEWPDGESTSITFPSNSSHGEIGWHQGIEVHPDTAANDRVISGHLATSEAPPSQNPDLVPSFEHAPPAASEHTPLIHGRWLSQSHSQV
jgi:Ca2+-transporting ATPase